jgi:hypothetical protein
MFPLEFLWGESKFKKEKMQDNSTEKTYICIFLFYFLPKNPAGAEEMPDCPPSPLAQIARYKILIPKTSTQPCPDGDSVVIYPTSKTTETTKIVCGDIYVSVQEPTAPSRSVRLFSGLN